MTSNLRNFTQRLKDSFFSEASAIVTIVLGIFIILVSLILFLSKGNFQYNSSLPIDESKIAQFGDFIGGFVGSIFSLVGILLFYVALRDQRKDFATGQETLQVQLEAFKQQVKEFEAQREELTETRKIYEQQNKTMKIQQFDSNFYPLLNVFIQQRSDLDPNGNAKFFSNLCEEMQNDFEYADKDFSILFKEACEKYIVIYNNFRPKLALYFMMLYRLIKIIENNENLYESEKIIYHKIVRSLITKEELIMLYYNYQSSFGKKPLPIIMKYNYLKHLERLDKLEFSGYSFNGENAVKANRISDIVNELITTNLHQAGNLDQTTEVREEVTIFEGVIVGIYIEDLVEIKVMVDLTVIEVIGLPLARFVKFMECISIDVLYHSQFKKFEAMLLAPSVLTTDAKNEYIFKFTLN